MAFMAGTVRSGNNQEPAGEAVGQSYNNVIGFQEIDYQFISKLDDEAFAFEWSLENYTNIIRYVNEIPSPVAIGGAKSKHSWRLKLYPKKVFQGVEYLSVTLSLTDFGANVPSSTQSIKARFQLSIHDADGYLVKQLGHRGMPALEWWKFSEWGWRHITTSAEIERYLVNGALRLHCVVWIEIELEHFVLERLNAHPIPTKEELHVEGQLAFAKDIATYFSDSVQADVIIKVEDDLWTFMAHKTILRARSPVFERIFSTSRRERKEVTVKNFDRETVESMLEWIYTGKTAKMVELAPDLLQIAVRYELQELKDKCEMLLVSNLCIANVARIFVLAHVHNVPYLKQRAMEFIISNKERVVKTKGFKEMVVSFGDTGVFVDLFLNHP